MGMSEVCLKKFHFVGNLSKDDIFPNWNRQVWIFSSALYDNFKSEMGTVVKVEVR